MDGMEKENQEMYLACIKFIEDEVTFQCSFDRYYWDDVKDVLKSFFDQYQPERSKREDPEKGCGALNTVET